MRVKFSALRKGFASQMTRPRSLRNLRGTVPTPRVPKPASLRPKLSPGTTPKLPGTSNASAANARRAAFESMRPLRATKNRALYSGRNTTTGGRLR